MFDTHCHLTHPRILPDVEAVVARSREAGLLGAMTIGTGVEDARRGRELSVLFPGFVCCAAGIDPFTAHRLGEGFGDELAALRELLSGGSFRALGEIGLDYHYALDDPRVQAARFVSQLALAAELALPVVIHVREAHADMAAILSAHPQNRGIIHSFTGSASEAERYLALGWHLAFNGVLTYPNAPEVREAARIVPDDRLLLETDSPYLAPAPLRGKRCEPAHVAHTARLLAQLRGVTLEELTSRTTSNATSLLGVA